MAREEILNKFRVDLSTTLFKLRHHISFYAVLAHKEHRERPHLSPPIEHTKNYVANAINLFLSFFFFSFFLSLLCSETFISGHTKEELVKNLEGGGGGTGVADS